MRHRLRKVARSRGAQAAATTITACAVLGIVGAAQGAEEVSVLGKDDLTFVDNDITVQTGDTVTWKFDGAAQPHNAQMDHEEPSEGGDLERWEQFNTAGPNFEWNKPGSFRFLKPGTYRYVCIVHAAGMRGIVRVEGDPIEETPTPTPTATPTVEPTATATPTPTPAPDDHTTTPPPTASSASDGVAPALTSLKASGKRGVAKLRFKLSETSTVGVRVKKGKKTVRTVSLQVAAGTRTIKVRSGKLKAGRYTIELVARDAIGNTSKPLTTSLRIKRK